MKKAQLPECYRLGGLWKKSSRFAIKTAKKYMEVVLPGAAVYCMCSDVAISRQHKSENQ